MIMKVKVCHETKRVDVAIGRMQPKTGAYHFARHKNIPSLLQDRILKILQQNEDKSEFKQGEMIVYNL